MRAAFGRPGFSRLFLGVAASMFGDSLLLIVLAIWVKDLTGSNAAAGLTFFWVALPSIVAPALGWVVDRVRRRRFLIVGNLLSAAAVLPLLAVRGESQVWVIYLVALLYGVSFVMLPAALNGLVKQLLPDDLLVDANSSLATVKEAFRLVGPLAGAALYGLVGAWAVVLIDALSFVLAAVAIASIRLREARPEPAEQRWRHEVTAGLGHVWRDRVLRHALVAIAMTLLVIGFAESATFAVTDAFGKDPEYVSVLVSIMGVGAIASGLLTGRAVRAYGEVRVLIGALVLLAAGMGLIAGAPTMLFVWVAELLFGLALTPLIIAVTTLLQRRTPQRLMGRVTAASDVLIGTPQTLSIAAGAVLVTALDYRLIFGVIAATTLLAAAYLTATLGTGPVAPAAAADDTVPDRGSSPVSGRSAGRSAGRVPDPSHRPERRTHV